MECTTALPRLIAKLKLGIRDVQGERNEPLGILIDSSTQGGVLTQLKHHFLERFNFSIITRYYAALARPTDPFRQQFDAQRFEHTFRIL